MNKQNLKALVSKDEIQQALNILTEITNSEATNLQNDAVHLHSRYNGYLKDLNAGTVDKERLEITLNNIRNSLNFLIDRLPEKEFTVTLSQQGNTTTSPQPFGDTPPPSQPGSENQPMPHHADKKPSHIPWIVGLGLLIGMIALLVLIPCPTGSQFFAFRLALALAAGGLVTQLPGMFGFEWSTGVKSAGAVGFAAMIWLVNPGEIIGKDKCNSDPFNFTARLQKSDLPNYPPLKSGNLKVWVVNRYEKPELNSDLLAEVKGIPASEEGKRVDVSLEGATYWKLASDSVTLSKNSQPLQAVPDGSLDTLSGKVTAESKPLGGVTIEIEGGLTGTSDTGGRFVIPIPLQKQKEVLLISAFKEGYERIDERHNPASGEKIFSLVKTKPSSRKK